MYCSTHSKLLIHCRSLLSGLDARGLWLNSLLLGVSPHLCANLGEFTLYMLDTILLELNDYCKPIIIFNSTLVNTYQLCILFFTALHLFLCNLVQFCKGEKKYYLFYIMIYRTAELSHAYHSVIISFYCRLAQKSNWVVGWIARGD